MFSTKIRVKFYAQDNSHLRFLRVQAVAHGFRDIDRYFFIVSILYHYYLCAINLIIFSGYDTDPRDTSRTCNVNNYFERKDDAKHNDSDILDVAKGFVFRRCDSLLHETVWNTKLAEYYSHPRIHAIKWYTIIDTMFIRFRRFPVRPCTWSWISCMVLYDC